MPPPDHDRELETIRALAGGDRLRAYQIVEAQLGVLVLRTQVLLSLCGIVITVTGFSGRAIAETSSAARLLIATGIAVVLLAAAVAIGGVLGLRWVTQLGGGDLDAMLLQALARRDRKARFLGAAMGLFVGGFGCYVAAIVQLLLAAQPR